MKNSVYDLVSFSKNLWFQLLLLILTLIFLASTSIFYF